MSSSPNEEKNKKIPADSIGARLRGLREREKLSIRQWAEKYGFNYPLWSEYENNKRVPNHTTMKKICDLFGVTNDWVLYDVDPARELKRLARMEEESTRYVEKQVDFETGRSNTDTEGHNKAATAGRISPRGHAMAKPAKPRRKPRKST